MRVQLRFMAHHKTILVAAALIGFAGCESEEARQHHLYNLRTCVAETVAADEVAFESTGNQETDKVMASFDRQSMHNYRAAECVSHEEKTTIEYQLDKHDDYGKVCGANEKWAYDHCAPKH